MDERKDSSRDITLRGVCVWLLRSGAYAAVVAALVGIGSTWRDVALQREQLRAHEESQKADMERLAEKDAAQDEKMAKHGETQERILAILEEHGRALVRLEERNEKALARLEERLVRLEEKSEKALVRFEERLVRLEEKNEKALARLESKLDDFMRGGKNSASLDEEVSSKNVSARMSMNMKQLLQHQC